MTKRKARPIWRLTIRLNGVMPIVWRTILVRPETKLAMLHRYLQAAMGWRDCHLFGFTIDGRRYGIPDREASEMKIYDARRYSLERLFPNLPAQCDYLYDFGDSWEHVISLEGTEDPVFRRQYPICVAGAEPCPPEDCGGPAGYREFLAALKNPSHPQHAHLSAWATSPGYRETFSRKPQPGRCGTSNGATSKGKMPYEPRFSHVRRRPGGQMHVRRPAVVSHGTSALRENAISDAAERTFDLTCFRFSCEESKGRALSRDRFGVFIQCRAFPAVPSTFSASA